MTQCCQCEGGTPPPSPRGACCYGCSSNQCENNVAAGDCLSRECSNFYPNQNCSQITCPNEQDTVCCMERNSFLGTVTKLGCIPDDGHPQERVQDCIAAGFTTTNVTVVYSSDADCNENCTDSTTVDPDPLGMCCICRQTPEGKYYTCVSPVSKESCEASSDCFEEDHFFPYFDCNNNSQFCPQDEFTTAPPNNGCCINGFCSDNFDCPTCVLLGGVCLSSPCSEIPNNPCTGACCTSDLLTGAVVCSEVDITLCQNSESVFHPGKTCDLVDCESSPTTTVSPSTDPPSTDPPGTTLSPPNCPSCRTGPLSNCGTDSITGQPCTPVGGCKMIQTVGERLECVSVIDGSIVEVFCNDPVGCCCCCPEGYNPSEEPTTTAEPTTTVDPDAPTTTVDPDAPTTTVDPAAPPTTVQPTTTEDPCGSPCELYCDGQSWGYNIGSDQCPNGCDCIYRSGGEDITIGTPCTPAEFGQTLDSQCLNSGGSTTAEPTTVEPTTTTSTQPPENCCCPDSITVAASVNIVGDCVYSDTGSATATRVGGDNKCTGSHTYTANGTLGCGDTWSGTVTCNADKEANDPDRWSLDMNTCQVDYTDNSADNPNATGSCDAPPAWTVTAQASDTSCPCCAGNCACNFQQCCDQPDAPIADCGISNPDCTFSCEDCSCVGDCDPPSTTTQPEVTTLVPPDDNPDDPQEGGF